MIVGFERQDFSEVAGYVMKDIFPIARRVSERSIRIKEHYAIEKLLPSKVFL
jgi:hypothetical protein